MFRSVPFRSENIKIAYLKLRLISDRLADGCMERYWIFNPDGIGKLEMVLFKTQMAPLHPHSIETKWNTLHYCLHIRYQSNCLGGTRCQAMHLRWKRNWSIAYMQSQMRMRCHARMFFFKYYDCIFDCAHFELQRMCSLSLIQIDCIRCYSISFHFIIWMTAKSTWQIESTTIQLESRRRII